LSRSASQIRPNEYRRRPAPVIAVAALVLASGSAAAELLPGVGALDRRLAVDAASAMECDREGTDEHCDWLHWEAAVAINIAVTASANIALPVTALPEAP
jgi:hypothetical protein